MALAAVCPSCSTRFRVVADQLKLKNGWVRCGSCAFAFNAVERLSYVPDDTIVHRRSALDELIAKTRRESQEADAANRAAATGTQTPATPLEQSVSAALNIDHAALDREAAAASPEPAATLAAEKKDAEALPWPTLQEDVAAEKAAAAAKRATPPPTGTAEPAPQKPVAKPRQEAPPDDDDAYELHTIIELEAPADSLEDHTLGTMRPADELAAQFLQRDAQDAARARRINRAAGAGSVIAALALAGQMAFTFRNELAASAPVSRPALDAMCQALTCTIDLPAHANVLSLDSLQLAQVGTSDLYQATALVKNTSGMTQRAPYLELTLTRVNGDILARRVFAPKDWLPNAATSSGLPARGETVAQFSLRVDKGTAGVNGFSGFGGALFYPTP